MTLKALAKAMNAKNFSSFAWKNAYTLNATNTNAQKFFLGSFRILVQFFDRKLDVGWKMVDAEAMSG